MVNRQHQQNFLFFCKFFCWCLIVLLKKCQIRINTCNEGTKVIICSYFIFNLESLYWPSNSLKFFKTNCANIADTVCSQVIFFYSSICFFEIISWPYRHCCKRSAWSRLWGRSAHWRNKIVAEHVWVQLEVAQMVHKFLGYLDRPNTMLQSEVMHLLTGKGS